MVVNSQTDQQLLHEYLESGSEAAFSEFVRRHVDFVYSVALRLVRDAHLAGDVSQGVFLAVARNASELSTRTVLAGWLHRTTQNLSANAIRSDVRRRTREQQAAAMNDLLAGEPDALWESIAPHLDAALSELNDSDREAVLQRYFQRKSSREMSLSLGVSTEAAQKRVNRAVDRLRELFARRGIAIGANGLILLVTANAMQAAPSGLVATISAAVLVAAPIKTSAALATAKIIAMTTLQKTLVVSVIAAALGTGIYQARQIAQGRDLAQRHQAAMQGIAPFPKSRKNAMAPVNPRPVRSTLAAKPTPAAGPVKTSAAMPFTSTHMYALLKTKVSKLTQAQVEPYLRAHRRDAASLLAAFRTTSDPALLAEALKKYPDDPHVAFEASIRNDASPAEQREGLDAFKQSAPDNSLADYLSALAHLKAGETAPAIADLVASSGKQQFQDYSKERIQSDEEAYLAAGYPPGEAKFIASTFLATPQLVSVRELGNSLIDLAGAYQQAGDENSRAAALQRAAELGQRWLDPSADQPLATQLMGINIERAALNGMEPTSLYSPDGQTVQQRLDELAQQKEAIHVLTKQADPLWQTLSDQAWLECHSQVAASGESQALQWLVASYGPK